MGLKVNEITFFVSFFTTIVTLFIARSLLSGQAQYLAIPISILANAISFFLTNFIQNKGFVRADSPNAAPSLKPFEDNS